MTDRSDLTALLEEARQMKQEVAGVREVLTKFYVPRGELNQKLSWLATGLILVLLGVVAVAAFYAQRGFTAIIDAQLENEIEVVEHRIADKQFHLDDRADRLCLYNAVRAEIAHVHRDGPAPPPDPCGFGDTTVLDRQVDGLEVLLEDLEARRRG